MIEQQDVLQILVEACPSFADDLQAHLNEYGNDLLYVAAGAFAHHLLSIHQHGDSSALANAAAAIERLHVEGSPWVKEFATIGLLEGVQNVWGNNHTDPEAFSHYLQAESKRWRVGLNRFWSGTTQNVTGEA